MREVERPDPALAPPPVELYLATVVEIAGPDGTLVVTPSADGPSPAPADHLDASTVHLVTAANPFSQETADEENARRNIEAAHRLEELGIRHLPSLGRDAGRTWVEPGFALLDADDRVVMDLADDWSQHGIYRWTADGWSLVLTDGSPPTTYPVTVTRA